MRTPRELFESLTDPAGLELIAARDTVALLLDLYNWLPRCGLPGSIEDYRNTIEAWLIGTPPDERAMLRNAIRDVTIYARTGWYPRTENKSANNSANRS